MKMKTLIVLIILSLVYIPLLLKSEHRSLEARLYKVDEINRSILSYHEQGGKYPVNLMDEVNINLSDNRFVYKSDGDNYSLKLFSSLRTFCSETGSNSEVNRIGFNPLFACLVYFAPISLVVISHLVKKRRLKASSAR